MAASKFSSITTRVPGVASRQLLAAYRRYLETGISNDNHQALIRQALRASRGRALDRAASRAAKVYPINNTETFPAKSSVIADGIRKDGYCVLTSYAAEPDQLQAFAHAAQDFISTDTSHDLGDIGAALAGGTTSTEMLFLPEEWVLSQHLTQRLLSDPLILGVANSYLGVSPVLSQANSWFSFVSPKASRSQSAQQWHWDCDRIRWLKVFLYISEVGPESGPHEFVRGTHRRLPRTDMSSRVREEVVLARYGRDEITSFCGPPGTLIFEDTRGLHRGRPVVAGHRLVLQLEFSMDLFGAPWAPLPPIEDPELAASLRTVWPRLFLRSAECTGNA